MRLANQGIDLKRSAIMETNQGYRPKTFAIIGAGPVGAIVAAFLAQAGYDVTLCDVIPELLESAQDPGIIIEGVENIQSRVTRTVSNVAELADIRPEVIFIAVKAPATPLLAATIKDFHREGTYLVSWQNGIDTEEAIARELGEKATFRAVVNYGCGLRESGRVVMPFHHPPHFIQERHPQFKPVAAGIAKALTKSGLTTQATDEIVSKIWRKTILNASMSPVCATTGFTMSEAMSDPIVFKIVDSLIKECIKIARNNEIFLGHKYYPDSIAYLKNAGNHKPSMLMDMEAKRRTEVDYINGKFIEYAEQADIEAPYNITIRNLVKALESKF